MAKRAEKTDFPISQIRRYQEPGPIVLVSSALGDGRNIMTMGWHTVMEFTPSRVGCVIASGNYSFDLRKSRECVINLQTTALTDTVVGIGNTTGAEIGKFERFGLPARTAKRVKAPLIAECHAGFECKLADDALIDKYNSFIFEVVKTNVTKSPKHPETLHYIGDGVFMVSGKIISRRSLFRRPTSSDATLIFRPTFDDGRLVNRGARLMLRSAVVRNAHVEEPPRLFGIHAAAVRAELRRHREVERKLGANGRFPAAGVANDIERLSEIVDGGLHGTVSMVVSIGKCDRAPARRQWRALARPCFATT